MNLSALPKLTLCLLLLAATVSAGVIGNWSGSLRTWNSYDMQWMKSYITSQGHTVLPDGGITAAGLSAMTHFLIGEASAPPSAAELANLSSWLNAGGILLVIYDAGCTGCSGNNPTLAALGSSIQGAGSASVAPFTGGNFATAGLEGQTLPTTQGTALSGGTALAGSYLRYEAIGNGHIFAFGDRSDHSYFSGSPITERLFLNIMNGPTPVQPQQGGGETPTQGGGSGSSDVPEPASVVLFLLGAVGLAVYRWRS